MYRPWKYQLLFLDTAPISKILWGIPLAIPLHANQALKILGLEISKLD